MKTTSSLLLMLSLWGCASSPIEQAAVEVAPPPPTAVATASAAPADDPPLPLERRAERVVCAGRDGCALLKVRKAGVRGDETLYAAFVERVEQEKGRPPRQPTRSAPLETDGNNEVLGMELDGCTTVEVWLISEGTRGVSLEQQLGEACNDGYGAAGLGEDTFTFDERGTFVHSRFGGSAWRWGETTTMRLDPPAIIKSEWSGYWSVAQNSESSSFDYRTFSGKTEWENEPCDANGTPPTQQGGPVEQLAYAAIPELDPKAIAGVDVDKTPLGGCSATIDGSESGYVLSGSEAKASSSMRVLAVGGQLHVDIDDDKFVDKGARRDEIEVWFVDKPADWTAHCLPKQSRPSGFAIPLAAGPIRKLSGSLAEPDVVRSAAQAGGTRRLKIEILPRMQGVTLVYRDTDDGTSVGRAIATSDFDPKKDASIGRLQKVDAARATCTASDGKLTVVLSPLRDKIFRF